MEGTTIKFPKQLMDSIKAIVESSKLYNDEKDFIEQAIIKQVSKHNKNV